MLLAALVLTGCIVDSAGLPLGADTAHSLARRLSLPPGGQTRDSRLGHGAYCAEACSESEEPVAKPEPHHSFPADQIGLTAVEQHVEEPLSSSDNDACDVAKCSEGNDETHPDFARRQLLPLDAFGVLLSAASVPASAVGGIANVCFPSEYIGPEELPPPSRFNPVPTRPVFTPREPSAYSTPAAL